MNEFLRALKAEFILAVREAPRVYRAIFFGAFRGIREEFDAIAVQRKMAAK
jgi:hypothetical protein